MISNEMPILLLILVDDILVVYRYIQRNFLISTFMSKYFFSNLCGKGRHILVFLRNNTTV